MNDITEQEINQISRDIDEHGLTYLELKNELLDHICCEIEEAMESVCCSMMPTGKSGKRWARRESGRYSMIPFL